MATPVFAPNFFSEKQGGFFIHEKMTEKSEATRVGQAIDLNFVEETPSDVSANVKKLIGLGDDNLDGQSFGEKTGDKSDLVDPRYDLRSDFEDRS